jgi:hypothetical protein
LRDAPTFSQAALPGLRAAATLTLCTVTHKNWCSTPDLTFMGGITKCPLPQLPSNAGVDRPCIL